MRLPGFAGYSGSGKTALPEAVIALLTTQGLGGFKYQVHHRHRTAGAQEVLIASKFRRTLMHEPTTEHRAIGAGALRTPRTL